MEHDSNKPVQLNIRETFRKKNPRIMKFMPGFVFMIIESILHMKQMNAHLVITRDKLGIDFAKTSCDMFDLKLVVRNEENIPKEGRLIFVANHPLGGLESLGMIHIIGQHHKKLKFFVNDILCAITNMNEIFVPINKHGAQAKESIAMFDQVFASEHQVLFYPAGLVSRKVNGKIVDLEWKKYIIKQAVKHKRDIVPIHINARNTNFFYWFANFRKKIGIKANIEMMLLPDEMYKQTGKTITYTIGKPISYGTFDKSKTPEQWAEHVKEIVYSLNK